MGNGIGITGDGKTQWETVDEQKGEQEECSRKTFRKLVRMNNEFQHSVAFARSLVGDGYVLNGQTERCSDLDSVLRVGLRRPDDSLLQNSKSPLRLTNLPGVKIFRSGESGLRPAPSPSPQNFQPPHERWA